MTFSYLSTLGLSELLFKLPLTFRLHREMFMFRDLSGWGKEKVASQALLDRLGN